MNKTLHQAIDLNERDENGRNALHLAAGKGLYRTVKKIIENVIDCEDENGDTPLMFAVKNEHSAAVEILIKHGADLNHKNKAGYSIISEAVWIGYPTIVIMLLNAKADSDIVDEKGYSLLHTACCQGFTEIAKLLIFKYHADINQTNNTNLTPVILAASNDHSKILDILLKKGARYDIPSRAGVSPLESAIHNNATKCIKLLVTHCIDKQEVNVLDKKCRSFLQHICKYGDLDLTKMLVEAGANINTDYPTGYTSVHAAASAGHTDILKYLHNNGGDINKVTKYGISPLHLAAKEGHLDTVKLFINLGADIYTRSSPGETPIFNAVRGNHLSIVKLLINSGANIDTKNNEGKTILEIAKSQKQQKIVSFLESLV